MAHGESGHLMLRACGELVAAGLSALWMSLLRSTVWLLSPWRLGRLVGTVSIPRLREHGLRTGLTVLGVALGVAILLAVGIVGNSILRSINATVDDLAGKADLQIAAGNSGFAETLLDTVHAVPGVHRVTPVIQQIASVDDERAQGARLLILGVDFLGKEDAYFRDYDSPELTDIRRDSLSFLNSTTNIIVSREFARRFGYRIHDKIQLLAADGVQPFEIYGFVDSHTLGRAFGGAVAVMYYPAMQVSFGRGHNIDRLDVAAASGENVETVAERLRAALGPAFVVDRPTLRGDHVGKMLGSVRMALTLAGTVALLAGIFLIYNTMSTSVAQRKRELSILRALGTTTREVIWLLTLEGALIGTVSAALGTGLGIGLSRALLRFTSRSVDDVYMQLAVSEVQVQPWLIALGFVLGIVGATLASAVPAYRAAQVRPTESLHASGSRQVLPFAGRISGADWSGLALFAAAVLLLQIGPVHGVPIGAGSAATALLLGGALMVPRLVQLLRHTLAGSWIGIEAGLARDNLTRDMARTATTAAALMAGVALTMGFATFMESFISSLETWTAQVAPGDLFVTSGARVSGLSAKNAPMSADFAQALKAIAGVLEVRRIRLAEIDYQGVPIKVTSSDLALPAAEIHLRPIQGDEREIMQRLREEPVVTISENLARRYGLQRGDRIALATARGTQSFEIVGVVVDYTSDIGTVLMERRTYAAAWADERVDTFEVYLRPGVDMNRVRNAINARYGKDHDLFVLTNREFRDEFAKAVDQIYQVLRTLELATLIVAALGIINTLFAGVLDRVREIGALRAVGMLRAQLRKTLVIEATLLSLVGTLAGILIGLAIGYIMVAHIMLAQLGWYFPYQVPWRSVAELCLTTLPVSALAGWYPAKQAADLVVRDALDYE